MKKRFCKTAICVCGALGGAVTSLSPALNGVQSAVLSYKPQVVDPFAVLAVLEWYQAALPLVASFAALAGGYGLLRAARTAYTPG